MYSSFDIYDFFERTWWRLFQKRVMRTKFDIYVFILAMLFVNYNVRVDGRLLSPVTMVFLYH
jgi:hypothetical protein